MALSYQNYTGDNVTDTFSIPFTYTDTSEISVTVDGVAQTGLTFPSASTVQLTSPPATSTLVQVRRNTDLTARSVDYVSGSVLTEEDLDNSNIQVFHAAQEAVDKANDGIVLGADDKWDALNKVIKNVADPVANTDAVNKQFISTNLPNITTVAGISSDVTTVAGISSDVTAVAADATDIGTVSTNIASVNTVATNIADVVTVANDLNEAISEVETAALDLQSATSKIDTVSTNIANVNAVGGDIANVNTVAGSISNVNTVAGNNANVTTVAGISGDVTTVASNNANVTAVAGNATNINTVAANNANVTTVAGISANVTTVANDTADIGTVASNIADVNTVAANNANITAVAADATDIGTVASNIANVNAVGTDIANVNTVASNLTDVNNFADTYFISATAPASPTEGDLWFDTTNDVMKVYDGSGFVNAGSSVNGTSERQTYTATGGQTTFAATYDAGYVDVYLNGVKLIDGSDFTATDGSNIVLSTGATAGDTVDIVAYGTFDLLNQGATLSSLGIANHDNLTVDASGNVGIGMASPASLYSGANNLVVGGGSSATGMSIYSGTTDSGRIYFADGTSGAARYAGYVEYSHNNNTLQFGTNGTTNAVIDASGNVGIGSTSPSGKLQATGTIHATGAGTFPSTNTGIEIVPASSGGTNYIQAYNRDSSSWQNLNIGSAQTIFTTGGSERMRILPSGGITFNGDTAAANALDDYEEGTWTPTYTASGGSVSMASQIGKYTKIGDSVYVFCYVSASSSSLTGTLEITGLPFTSASSGTYGWLNATNSTWSWSDQPRSVYVVSSSTSVRMWDIGTNQIVGTDMASGAGSNLIFSLHYKVS